MAKMRTPTMLEITYFLLVLAQSGWCFFFTQSRAVVTVFQNSVELLPIYTPTVFFEAGEKKSLHFRIEGEDGRNDGWITRLFSLNSSSGEMAVQKGGVNTWNKNIRDKNKKKDGRRVFVRLVAEYQGELRRMTVAVKLSEKNMTCDLGQGNKLDRREELKDMLLWGSYHYRYLYGAPPGILGNLHPPQKHLEIQCGHNLQANCNIFNDKITTDGIHLSTTSPIISTNDVISFAINCTVTNQINTITNNVSATITEKFHRMGSLQIIRPNYTFPHPQENPDLIFDIQNLTSSKDEGLGVNLFTKELAIDFSISFDNRGCPFLTLKQLRSFDIQCGRNAMKNVSICQNTRFPESSSVKLIPLKLKLNRDTWELYKLNSQVFKCNLRVTDNSFMTQFGLFSQKIFTLTINNFRASKTTRMIPQRLQTSRLSLPVAQPISQKIVIIKTSWRGYARVTNLPSYGNWSQMECKDSNSKPLSLSVSGNIVYLDKKVEIEGQNREFVVCFEDETKKNQEQINIRIEEDTENCDSEMWCSEYGDKDNCEKACHSVTGVRCAWKIGGHLVSGAKQSKRYNYSLCTSSLETCYDKVCDQLEKQHDSICPQDCVPVEANRVMPFMQVITGGHNHGIRELRSKAQTCKCTSFNCKCLDSVHINQANQNEQHANNTRAVKSVKGNDSPDHSGPLFVVIGVAVAFILCALPLAVWTNRLRVSHKNDKYLSSNNSSVPSSYVGDGHSTTSLATTSTTLDNINNPHVFNIQIDQKFEFPRKNLILEETLGEGEFGKVLSAKALNFKGKAGYTRVAVKMLKSHHTVVELQDLLTEYSLLKEVTHPNVIKLLGACTGKGGPVYLIMEFAKHGSLRSFLRKCHSICIEKNPGPKTEEDEVYKINPKDIVCFAWQVAKGMAYLADMKLVHRDLAARNVLVAEGKVCKVSDFGLTRDVYIDEAYWKRSSGKLPIKWMAPESLRDHLYTTKSDVWSFGVLLWELVTLGSSPYPGVLPDRLFGLLGAGYRMDKPKNCSKDLYNMMLHCWRQVDDDRPTFKELTSWLEGMLHTNGQYLDLSPTIVNNSTYLQPHQDLEMKVMGYQPHSLMATRGEGIFGLSYMSPNPPTCYTNVIPSANSIYRNPQPSSQCSSISKPSSHCAIISNASSQGLNISNASSQGLSISNASSQGLSISNSSSQGDSISKCINISNPTSQSVSFCKSSNRNSQHLAYLSMSKQEPGKNTYKHRKVPHNIDCIAASLQREDSGQYSGGSYTPDTPDYQDREVEVPHQPEDYPITYRLTSKDCLYTKPRKYGSRGSSSEMIYEDDSEYVDKDEEASLSGRYGGKMHEKTGQGKKCHYDDHSYGSLVQIKPFSKAGRKSQYSSLVFPTVRHIGDQVSA